MNKGMSRARLALLAAVVFFAATCALPGTSSRSLSAEVTPKVPKPSGQGVNTTSAATGLGDGAGSEATAGDLDGYPQPWLYCSCTFLGVVNITTARLAPVSAAAAATAAALQSSRAAAAVQSR
ncbi:hypothetical protein GPECTOR_29g121 [Gonium pectorale]|uniref:Secreted protein n=1 Tax=Gonium pectorale TaxID=33097 RepID=A0A150GEF7_GONPE|nr:hypothetical protein GPECTOR_29g121 [Gonium pectorale]|eukprot:KXZ48216.1 hypothetical protein GPECTOR_29g121 [Gonium pectorale]